MPSYTDYADIDALRIEHYPPVYIKFRGGLAIAGLVLLVIGVMACLALRVWRQHARSRILLVQLKAKKSAGVMPTSKSRVQFMTESTAPLLPPV